jgi:integral membrane sensor domain MASE1
MRRRAAVYLTIGGGLSLAAALFVLIDAPRPVQIAAVLASSVANVVADVRAELSTKQTRREKDG